MAEPHKNQKWTPEQIDTVCAMLAQQATLSEIGAHFGVTKLAISGLVNRMKLANDPRLPANRNTREKPRPRNVLAAAVDRFAEALSQDMGVEQAGAAIGVGRGAAWKYFGVLRKKYGWQAA